MPHPQPCKIEYECIHCGHVNDITANIPDVCYECVNPRCRKPFHTELFDPNVSTEDGGAIIVVDGCL